LIRLRSDKQEWNKSAMFKFYFIEKLLSYWRTLLESDRGWEERDLNCCDSVLQALQAGLDPQMESLSEIHTSKMMRNSNFDETDILNSYLYYLPRKKRSNATAVCQYCFKMGSSIKQHYASDKNPPETPSVILRFNRWHKGKEMITKLDFNPLKFNPYFKTTRTKIGRDDLFRNIIKSSISSYVFPQWVESDPSTQDIDQIVLEDI
jgi:hypothetical protein